MKRIILFSIAAMVAVWLLAQFVSLVAFRPTNPPVVAEPQWDSPQTRALAQRACFACHSNETVWPLYSYVAPSSVLVVHDVQEGRQEFNFSEWTTRKLLPSARKLNEEIAAGSMPPATFLLLHPEARLTDQEKQQLMRGFEATLNRK